MASGKVALKLEISVPLYGLAMASFKIFSPDTNREDAVTSIIADRLQNQGRPITATSASDLRDYLVVTSGDATLPVRLDLHWAGRELFEQRKAMIAQHLRQEISDAQAVTVLLIDYVIEHAAVSLVDAIETK